MKLWKKVFAVLFCALVFFGIANALIGEGFDNTGPDVNITAPTAGQVFAAGTTSITLSYSATDVGGGTVSKYWVRKGTDSWIDNSLNTSYLFSSLSAGNFTFYVIATDDSDNNSSTASVSASISSTATCGNGVCDAGETTASCPGDCLAGDETCAGKGGSVCPNNKECSISVVPASDTSACCLGTCVAKSCSKRGGENCDPILNDCSSWIDQSANCCTIGACIPKQSSTILCSFQEYLANEPITAIFIEPSQLENKYGFNVVGKELEISPSLANELADTIVTQYPALATYLVATNLSDSPSMSPGSIYLLELLKKKTLFGTSGYSARVESFQNIYEFIDSSRIRWWNAKNDDTCGVKLDTKDYSLQTMHYFRINNLWLLWNDLVKKR